MTVSLTDHRQSGLRRLWRKAPPKVRKVVNIGMTAGAQRVGQVRGMLERGGPAHGPVCVMGLHRAVLGLGRGARLFRQGLDTIGSGNASWDVTALFGNDLTIAAPDADYSRTTTVLSHLNPIEHLHALALYEGPRPRRGFRVGYWLWETSRVPDAWIAGISAVDEIWCPSAFTANAVRQLVGDARPIRVMPIPLRPDVAGEADKARFGISQDKVTFFAACDLRSSINRKNPLGAIEAFQRSGCGQRGDAELLVKVHGDFPGSGLSFLHVAANQATGVRILDEKLSASDMRVLRSSIDVVLSPHRSEGFGLVLAEAMHSGKPVIATGWSGNMDFMDESSAALINSREVPVFDPSGTYDTGTWAEPDLDHAASLIQKLTDNAEVRQEIGAAGARRIAAFADFPEWQRRIAGLLNI